MLLAGMAFKFMRNTLLEVAKRTPWLAPPAVLIYAWHFFLGQWTAASRKACEEDIKSTARAAGDDADGARVGEHLAWRLWGVDVRPVVSDFLVPLPIAGLGLYCAGYVATGGNVLWQLYAILAE